MTAAKKLQQEEERKAKIIADFQKMDDGVIELSANEAELFKHLERESQMLEGESKILETDEEDAQ